MNDDATLLRRYAEEGSEAAFAELVRRHLDLVYGAALRRTGGDVHRAADVSQQVFTSLARNARRLSRHAVLSAWLHTASRNAALNIMISEHRRQTREAEAERLNPAQTAANSSPDWERLRPLLDAAVDDLPEADRVAVVLRFFERQGFADIGTALRVSADAARVRTDRALEKLRVALARQGITSTAAALGALVSSQSAVSAPAGLAATLAVQSMSAAGTGVMATTFLSLMTAKIIGTAIVAALIAFTIGTHFGGNRSGDLASPLPSSSEALRQSTLIGKMRQENQRLSADVAGLNAELARLKEANAALAAHPIEPAPASVAATRNVTLGAARWEIEQETLNNLRQINAARRQYKLENGHAAATLGEFVGHGPKAFIKRVQSVDGEDYSGLSMDPDTPLTVTTPNGITVTFDPNSDANTTHPQIPPEVVRYQELGRRLTGSVYQAVGAYRAANNGINPPNEQALIPYFATPKEGADFVEFMEAKKAAGM